MENRKEPYIPSVHLKNIAPLDFLKSKDGKDFLKKLQVFEELQSIAQSREIYVINLHEEIQKYHSFFKTLNEFLKETKDI